MIEKGKAVGGLLYQKLKNILSVGNILLNSQREKILKQISLPIDYVLELEDYVKRNSMIVSNSAREKELIVCCSRCLKAYALQMAREKNLEEREVAPLITLLDCEVGHNGYYEDQDSLAAISQ